MKKSKDFPTNEKKRVKRCVIEVWAALCSALNKFYSHPSTRNFQPSYLDTSSKLSLIVFE
jgi:hypothetical protein